MSQCTLQFSNIQCIVQGPCRSLNPWKVLELKSCFQGHLKLLEIWKKLKKSLKLLENSMFYSTQSLWIVRLSMLDSLLEICSIVCSIYMRLLNKMGSLSQMMSLFHERFLAGIRQHLNEAHTRVVIFFVWFFTIKCQEKASLSKWSMKLMSWTLL